MSQAKKIVLIVDDDKSILRTFARVLAKNGYYVDTAETGKEAVDKANQRFYDAALIDFRLPDMDGTDLLVKTQDTWSKTVKIIITGLSSVENGTASLDQGADAYLVKPVAPDALLSLIEEKLKSKV